MENQNSGKPIKNTLLQNANYGFSFDSLLSSAVIVPVSKEQSNVTEAAEIDSFIGQELNTQQTVPSNSIVNEQSTKSPLEQSVPLIVPSSVDSCDVNRISSTSNSSDENALNYSISSPAVDTPTSSIHFEENKNFFVQSTTDIVSNTTFFDPAQFEQNSHDSTGASSYFDNRFLNFKNSTSKTVVSSSLSQGSSNNYRLGNIKKPTYAPVPGLSSFPVKQQTFTPFTPSTSQNINAAANVSLMSSIGTPSTTGPYSSAMTQNIQSKSNKPSIVSEKTSLYRPVYHHWFYRKELEKSSLSVWKPFSMTDSLALESAFSLATLNANTVVATDGGRYDVNIVKREKVAVFWQEKKCLVRRCSWFSKGPADSYFIPYDEEIAAKLEEEYKAGVESGLWNRKIDIGNEEVIMQNSVLITHQIKCTNLTIEVASDSTIPSPLKPKIVKRGGFDDFDIDDGEPEKVDHLLFLVHGIGQFCDLKFRNIVEVVDEFRSISLQLTQSHFQESCELGEVNRIEVLPVSWHKELHSEHTGVDKRVKNITLPSIPRMRDFANDTILDLLFYTSPVYCQIIINAVASEINRLYVLFKQRNPNFNGKVSVGGHSLGSLILFDLLSNQPTSPIPEKNDDVDELVHEYDQKLSLLKRRISVVTIGKAGTGQPLVKYPRFDFHPRFFFAFGSPIACFVSTRSNEILGEDFTFPTCKGFFNIFHPYDPIAYRMEPLIIPSLSSVKPVQISHHKGRKRMHLELKDTVSHVGQRLVDTMKNTWNMLYHLAVNKSVDAAESVIQQELTQVLQTSEALAKKPMNPNLIPSEPINETTNVKVGCLNEGKRVDYVLQEAPVEYFNEYLFALASHLCYWTSRDTILLVLKEIYGDVGVYTDNQLPQTILPFDITDGSGNIAGAGVSRMTSQQSVKLDPPLGYVKK